MSSDETEEFSFLRGSDRSADRTLDERRAFLPDLGRKRDLNLGTHRAHVDEQLAEHFAREQSALTLIRRVDRRGVGKHGDDAIS